MTLAVRSQRDAPRQRRGRCPDRSWSSIGGAWSTPYSLRIVAALDVVETMAEALFEALLQLLAVVEEVDARAAVTVVDVMRDQVESCGLHGVTRGSCDGRGRARLRSAGTATMSWPR